MNKIFGVICLFFGSVLLSWIGYNYLVEMLPAAKGRDPFPALFLGISMIYVGINRFNKPEEPCE